MISSFVNKAISRFERIDKQGLQQLVMELSEEKTALRELFNTAREGILLINERLQVQFYNEAAKSILGIQQAEKPISSLEKLISDTELRSFIEKSVMEKREVYQELIELLSPRHMRINLAIRRSGSSLRDASSENYIVLLIPDITHDRSVKEKYQLEKLSSILSLGAGIAHEIGNPLNSINLHLQLLLKDAQKLKEPGKKRIQKSLEVILEETSRMDRIVRNFLRATRRKPLKFQLANIHDTLNETLALFEPEFKVQRIRVSADFSACIPNFLMDKEQIFQVLVNLIRNALEAMPEGGKLYLRTSAEQNVCEIAITDTGEGISKEVIPHIFDAYYTTKEEGNGLGLVIAYQIIKDHGGRLKVISKAGKGTAFKILLPIRKEKLQLPSPKDHHD